MHDALFSLLDTAWSWSSFDSKVPFDIQAAQLQDTYSPIGPCLSETEDGYAIFSDSQDSNVGEACSCKLADLLNQWGLGQLCAEDLPVIILPSPVCYLMLHGKVHHLTLLCSWHNRLIDRHGNRYKGMPLFHSTITICDLGLCM